MTGNKRARSSPVKGKDKCSSCAINLSEESSAMNCDDYDCWLCIECLELSKLEYILLKKMTRRMGYQWKCPMCKGNTQASNVNASKIARVVDASIKNSLSGFENAVKTLDVEIKEAVKNSLASFKDELKAEIDTQFKAVEDRIHTLEQSSGMAKDNNALKDLVTAKVATLKEALDEHFENRIKAMIAEDRERQKRKLNIVVFRVPPQTDDAQFVQGYLANDNGIPDVTVLNICRLGNITTVPGPITQRPIPIIFSVAHFKLKKLILQKSFERKGANLAMTCQSMIAKK
ncbi:hypothetical protein QYM36_007603 [Artemia franciscana]|uniref:Uncharacterized protein n=1 Tax=Artemia franciscana TaxID=6661 RepID=A0AA88IN42_ARTSF|nr:hypothetical protein QYM36_007603 [Artemia franciscana]